MPYLRKGARMRRGVGQVLTGAANPYPGTFSDVNCPGYCWLLGNFLGGTTGGCWPCGHICANGYAWDPTSQSCLAAPGAVASVVAPPTSGGDTPPDASCPGYCSWVPGASTLFSDCAPCAGAGSGSGLSSTAWIGIAVVAAIAVMALKK